MLCDDSSGADPLSPLSNNDVLVRDSRANVAVGRYRPCVHASCAAGAALSATGRGALGWMLSRARAVRNPLYREATPYPAPSHAMPPPPACSPAAPCPDSPQI